MSNNDITTSAWLQASLPVRGGGLGIRCVFPLTTSAFLASAECSSSLQVHIHLCHLMARDKYGPLAMEAWSSGHNFVPAVDPLAVSQPHWDQIIMSNARAQC